MWVAAGDAGDRPVWDVIAEDGRFLGQVQVPVPPSVRPAVRGDRFALATQVDGVPTVVVYDLVYGVQ